MSQTKAKVRNRVNLRYNAAVLNKSMTDGHFRTKIWCQPLYIYVIAKIEERTAKKVGEKEISLATKNIEGIPFYSVQKSNLHWQYLGQG